MTTAEVIQAAILEGRTPEQLEAYERGLITIGLWPPERQLLAEYVSVMGEEVAGVYIPAERALYVVSDVPTPFSIWAASTLAGRDFLAEFALAHELVPLLHEASGRTPDSATALRRVTGGDLAELDRRWSTWVQRNYRKKRR